VSLYHFVSVLSQPLRNFGVWIVGVTFILGVFLHIHLGELEPGNPFNYTHDCNIL